MKFRAIFRYQPTGPARVIQALLAFVTLLALLALLRLPTLINPRVINVDEAELMATGRLSEVNLTPYLEYTTGTLTFLPSFLLGILGRFGVPLDLVTAHVISGLIYVFLIFSCWLVLSRRLGWSRSALLVAPSMVVLFSGSLSFDNPDFLSLGTELLPILIILVSCLILVSYQSSLSISRYAVSCIVAGCAFWAKPQLLLLASCIVFLGASFLVFKNSSWSTALYFRSLLIGAVAFVIPTAIVVSWLSLAGTLDSFFQEVIRFNLDYIVSRQKTGGSMPSLLDRAAGVSDILLKSGVAFTLAIASISSVPSPILRANLNSKKRLIVVWVVPLAASFLTLLFVFPLFTHYLNIFFGACAVSTILTTGSLSARAKSEQPLNLSVALATSYAAVALVTVLAALPSVKNSLELMLGRAPAPTLWASSTAVEQRNSVLQFCPAKSRVLVWGWAAEMYSYYDWVPALRYVNFMSSWRELLGDRASTILRKVETRPPACIIDATDERFFAGFSGRAPFEQDAAELLPLVRNCYSSKSLPLIDGRSTSTYVLNQNCDTP